MYITVKPETFNILARLGARHLAFGIWDLEAGVTQKAAGRIIAITHHN